jgi:ankyrin repeat protein
MIQIIYPTAIHNSPFEYCMESILKTVAGAVQRGLDDPEWKYLHAYTIPDMEIRGYHLAKPIDLIVGGERNNNILGEGLDDADKKIVGQLLLMLEQEVPFHSQFSIGMCTAHSKKDINQMRVLLNMGYPVNKPCQNSSSPEPSLVTILHFAVQDGDRACINLLVESGADPTLIDQDGDSPLSMAIGRDQHDVIALFLQGNFDFDVCLNHVSKSGRHPLSSLFRSDKDGDLIDMVHAKGVKFGPSMTDDYWLPVMRVLTESIETADQTITSTQSQSKWHRMLRSILGMNYPPDSRLAIFTSPMTPLYFACSKGKHPVVRLLCEAGAGVNVEGNDEGYFPIEATISSGNSSEDCAIEIMQHGMDPDFILPLTGRTITHMAVLPKKWLRLFSTCLDKGGSLLIPCDDGNLPMPSAAQENMLEFIPPFVQRVPNAGDVLNATQPRNNMNAIGHALMNGHVDMIRALLEAGASPLIPLPDNDRSFLHSATLRGRLDICQVLVEYGADVAAKSSDSLPRPLDFAINQKHDDIALFFVEKGANPFEPTGESKGSPMSIMLASEALQDRLRAAWESQGNVVPQSYLDLRPPAPVARRASAPRVAVAVPTVPAPAMPRRASATSAAAVGSACAPKALPAPPLGLSAAPVAVSVHDAVAPPPPPVSSSRPVNTSASGSSSGSECRICLDREVNACFIHGTTSHTGCCYQCATEIFEATRLCPFCKAPIDLITRNYAS